MMDPPEIWHWGNLACARVITAAEAAAQTACQAAGAQSATSQLEVCSGVLAPCAAVGFRPCWNLPARS